METVIKINEDSCIGCGRCKVICPVELFQLKNDIANIETAKGCIVCGHCVAICPPESIIHSNFPKEKIHPINRAILPTSEQLIELIKARRSNRSFGNKPIPSSLLNEIVEAAHRAPTASNQQEVEYTLITDPDKLRLLSDITIKVFTSILNKMNNPFIKPVLRVVMADMYRYIPAFKKMLNEYKDGNDLILRNASAVLLIHTSKKSRYGCHDSNLAYQNGSLMAEALGIAQFYTGFVCSAAKQTKEINRAFGINGTIHAGMALGVAELEFIRYIDKKEINIKRI